MFFTGRAFYPKKPRYLLWLRILGSEVPIWGIWGAVFGVWGLGFGGSWGSGCGKRDSNMIHNRASRV